MSRNDRNAMQYGLSVQPGLVAQALYPDEIIFGDHSPIYVDNAEMRDMVQNVGAVLIRRTENELRVFSDGIVGNH